ncbi:MAG: ABC-2 family transporter protein, partial [Alphaproteobacteria bacterium]
FLSAAIAFASLAFWATGARSFSRELMDFTLLFSTYPGSIYHGAVKVIAFTLLPAGFIVLTPAKLIRNPGVETLSVVILASGGYAAVALGLFHLGLQRYRRGERLAG